MDLSKQTGYFDPLKDITAPMNIIGVGAIGSTVVENLTRLGVQELTIYDFDKVTPHNLTNQMYREKDIDAYKVDAILEICKEINPEIKINTIKEGYTGQNLTGYVFLCVDNIELRKKIAEDQKLNPMVKAMFDFRMGLQDAQHYATIWNNPDTKKNFIASMDFKHEEVKENTPTSPCGTELSILPTVRTIVSVGIANFINLIRKEELKNVILINAFTFDTLAFPNKTE